MEYGRIRFFDLYLLRPLVAAYMVLGAWSFFERSWTEGGFFIASVIITYLVMRILTPEKLNRAAQTAPSHDTTGWDFEGYIIARSAILASLPIGGTAFVLSWHRGYRYMAVLIGAGALVSFPALVSTFTAYIHKRQKA